MTLKKISLFLLIAFFAGQSLHVDAQENKLGIFLRQELNDQNAYSKVLANERFNVLISHLKEKKIRYKTDQAFLEYMFYYVHRKFLGEYEQYVTLGETFGKDKKYDCVTGSAMYTLILDELGYDFEIRETDYHVYVIAHAGGREFLLESTDPLNGFAYDPKEVKERKEWVLKDAKAINEKLAMSGVSSEASSPTITVINNSVSMKELAGLHFYNQALKEFNSRNYREAYRLATIAQGIYPSNRIKNAASYMFAVAFED